LVWKDKKNVEQSKSESNENAVCYKIHALGTTPWSSHEDIVRELPAFAKPLMVLRVRKDWQKQPDVPCLEARPLEKVYGMIQ
jgi:hypothetical protein